MNKIFIAFCLLLINSSNIFSQPYSSEEITEIIQTLKKDERGPYKDIKWFCEDGSIRDAKDPCPGDMKGFQHARYKDVVARLHQDKLYLGRILVGSKNEDLWNWEFRNDPLKQYMLNTYLEDIDDGWIKRKAQYYRGAIQSEDELEWAKSFFQWVLSSDSRVDNNFLLIRQAAKMIPHQSETEIGSRVRVLSKIISDNFLPFMGLRTKIHSSPEPSDLIAVQDFQKKYENKLPSSQKQNMENLLAEMEKMFEPVDINDLKPHISKLSNGELKERALQFVGDFSIGDREQRFERACELLFDSRFYLKSQKTGSQRLGALDISIILERMITNDLQDVEVESIGDLMEQLCYMNSAIAGAGYIEQWEHEKSRGIAVVNSETISLHDFSNIVDHHRRIAEWSATHMTSLFTDVVQRYIVFEPASKSFIDDQIRSTILLQYGDLLSDFAEIKNGFANLENDVLGISNQERIRGLNPGYALGKLEVVERLDENIVIDRNKIYAFMYPPSDIGPVTGIMTVNEGNVVSHVQLLARNLGIPNAVISEDNMKSLKQFDGQDVFYAVSLSGNVIIKKASKMTKEEEDLFSSKERVVQTITVEVDKIDLERDTVVNMRDLSGKDSGISCGPKAANLAQLKKIFPENVVEGVVIPFGVYKRHMDQKMETRSMTYWEFINQIFKDKATLLKEGVAPKEVECIVEGELGILRENIYKIKLTEEFKANLQSQFQSIFAKPIGQIPVFLRSDTNMEDLKDFTGAGLNLTKFNILDEAEIYQGIREVWASPFTERSYKWRQSYLNNPENVYPSILVIPSVNVDYSGVIITKDINNGSDEDLTVAFSRGVGGAVDGQRAETYIIKDDKYYDLVSPSREATYRTIPETGGSKTETAYFSEPILTNENLANLIEIVNKVKVEIPRNTDMVGPYDIELGFKDNKIWLFQIRPFVENKTASSSEYLESISPEIIHNSAIDLNQKIKL